MTSWWGDGDARGKWGLRTGWRFLETEAWRGSQVHAASDNESAGLRSADSSDSAWWQHHVNCRFRGLFSRKGVFLGVVFSSESGLCVYVEFNAGNKRKELKGGSRRDYKRTIGNRLPFPFDLHTCLERKRWRKLVTYISVTSPSSPPFLSQA